jgi:hypothetical protein
MKTEQCSETSTNKIQRPGNHPKERIQHSEHGESLKSRTIDCVLSQNVATRLDQLFGHPKAIFARKTKIRNCKFWFDKHEWPEDDHTIGRNV